MEVVLRSLLKQRQISINIAYAHDSGGTASHLGRFKRMSHEELRWLGLSDSKVAETVKNRTLTEQLIGLVNTARQFVQSTGGDPSSFPKQKGSLLYHIGTKAKAQCTRHLPLLVKLIVEDKVKTETQVTEGISYILTNALGEVKEKALEEACGVGIVVSKDMIEDAVAESINKHKQELLEDRYHFPTGKILGDVRSKLKWADGKYIATEVELQIRALLGPKTEEDNKPKEKKVVKKENGKSAKIEKKTVVIDEDVSSEGAATIDELIKTRTKLHKPGENYKTEGYVTTENTSRLLKEHLARTGGKVRTRFPPEPNGLLHIGHAKAININFGYAKAFDGVCFLRFDDTNPEKEEKKFFEGISDMVHWLGYTPYKTTYSSDYFQQLFEWAIVLIKKGHAYVCHQSVDQMRGFDVQLSPWRNRPIEESLQLFQDMKKGKLDEGEATLRLKITLEEGKVDPVAYRIKYCHHERTKNQWCIYPTYDYTHCLCDSIEDITHSLCTKEFQSRRSSYYWLCNALDIYCPVQWEYGRLNVNYTVVSKRKILKLIETKVVRDWDDPRLFTLASLRRRGIPAEALNSFVAQLGLTGSQMVVDPHLLDASVRDYLNANSPRTMAVLNPLKVTICNLCSLSVPATLEVRDFPSLPSSSTHSISFSSPLFIERDDYASGTPSKDFKRLAKGQTVGLKHIGLVLEVEKEITGEDGTVVELIVTAKNVEEGKKPKAFIHWVASPVAVQVRLYDRLFHHKNPEDTNEVPAGFLSDCNKNSLTLLYGVLVDSYLKSAKVWDRFQFERIGFFSVDQESKEGRLIFNRTVLLKEDSGKK